MTDSLSYSLSSINDQIEILEELASALIKCRNQQEKLDVLNNFLRKPNNLSKNALESLVLDGGENELVYKSLCAIGQQEHILRDFDNLSNAKDKLEQLFSLLKVVDKLYDSIGGIIGYHLAFLKLLIKRPDFEELTQHKLEKPAGFDFMEESAETRRAIRWGIENMEKIGEIYPVAGAGDRLDLHDETTKEPLPAAELKFLGFTLLEGLIRDLQGREYLYYKLTGKQAHTPVALMTSHEKNNDKHILAILSKHNWFNRKKSLFFLFMQPSVPVIAQDGSWVLTAPLNLFLKPGGHGVIWKLALDSGAFAWLDKHSRTKALIRQINNPVAGIDYALLAFTGLGCHLKKSFGFVSCPRLLGASEGMDVLIETPGPDGVKYCITNIEYTEFERCGISDIPLSEGSPYSLFPSNTNILFADLNVVKALSKQHPIPNLLINMKSEVHCLNAKGESQNIKAGRLESTMQNIADYIVSKAPNPLTDEEKKNLPTFVTYNKRRKTISVTKKLRDPGKPILETPEGALFDVQFNAGDLLSNYCKFTLPKMREEKEFLEKGPSYLVFYHPALGPLYSVIAQKIQGGILREGSELNMEIAELELKNLDLKGSLLIKSSAVTGSAGKEESPYSEEAGKCTLIDVTVSNQGIDFTAPNQYWKNSIIRKESLGIHLEGNGEFYARNVTFKGPMEIKVPHGHRMIAKMEEEQVQLTLEKIDKPTWSWEYTFSDNDFILLKRKSSCTIKHCSA